VRKASDGQVHFQHLLIRDTSHPKDPTAKICRFFPNSLKNLHDLKNCIRFVATKSKNTIAIVCSRKSNVYGGMICIFWLIFIF